jgi:tRNA/tmRNA/rRNA uracil-C5-methylase (TrmA/RlmC/RlmD family)
VAPAAQRDWKTAVAREQLTRLGGLTADEVDALGARVTPLPGGELGWRTRVRYAVDAAGRPGLLKHRSHEVVPIDRCLIAHPAIQGLPVLGRRWPDAEAVETVASSGGDRVVRPLPADGPSPEVREHAAGRRWTLPADAFWQVHPAAADTLAAAVLDLLEPAAGERAWDLYGGAGLFAAALAERVGPTGRVTLVESAPPAVAAARRNLADLAAVEVVAARVETALARRRITGPVDLVVLDPPRTGAGADVVRAVAAAGPRAVAYVACDPAAFARDVGTFRQLGWRLAALDGFDCFPMTHHLELVGLLVP